MMAAGVPVEVRVEPLISGLTDTRDNLQALFGDTIGPGRVEVTAHYLFLAGQPVVGSTAQLAGPRRAMDGFEGGPAFPLGSVGTTKHLPVETAGRAWRPIAVVGAEFGLRVRIGQAQNPDLAEGTGQGRSRQPRQPPDRWRPAASAGPVAEPALASA
ncbi:MAG: hypothetical protein U0800_05310 [Isosphaeraceae bacterium]